MHGLCLKVRVLEEASTTQLVIPVEKNVMTFGRSKSSDVRLKSRSVSHHHCLLNFTQISLRPGYFTWFLLALKKKSYQLPLLALQCIWLFAMPVRKPFLRDLNSQFGTFIKFATKRLKLGKPYDLRIAKLPMKVQVKGTKVQFKNKEETFSVELGDKPVLLGRELPFFQHDTISRSHFRLNWEGDQVRISDVGSLNGLWERIFVREFGQSLTMLLGSAIVQLQIATQSPE